MTPVRVNQPSVLQGMSQQASRLMRDTEARLQINGVSDTQEGLGNRPGTQHISSLFGLNGGAAVWTHWIERDDVEQYLLAYDGSALRAYDFTGATYPVIADYEGLSYLASLNPERELSALTVQDVTYLTNRTKVPAMEDYAQPEAGSTAVIWVRAGNYKTEYSVTIDGQTASFETASSGAGSADETIQTNNIADELATAIDAALDASYTVTRVGNVISVVRVDGSDMVVSTEDSVGDSQMSVVKHAVSRFSDLPPRAPDGYVAHVKGLDSVSADDYWVRFVSDEPTLAIAEGRWEETAAPGSHTRIDASTMPHKLERLQDDLDGTVTGVSRQIYFQLSAVDWRESIAGDDDTNPPPSFMGRPLHALFVLGDRLGFLGGSQVVLSASGDFVQLRRTSMQSLAPDDRIDVTAGGGEVVNLRYAVALSEQLLLAGDDALMAVPTDVAIEPASFRFTTTTKLRMDTDVPPLVVGRSMFMPVRNGLFSDIRESVASGVDRVRDSTSITLGVPELLRGSIKQWSADDTGMTLYARTDLASKRLYVYKWLDGSDARVQSSWGFWRFDDPILSMKVLGKRLWLVFNRPEGPTLEFIDLEVTSPQEGQFRPFRLDRFAVLTTPVTANALTLDPDVDDGPPPPSGAYDPFGGDPTDLNTDAEAGHGVVGFGGGVVPIGGGGGAQVVQGSSPEEGYTEFELPYCCAPNLRLIRSDNGEEIPWEEGTTVQNIRVQGDASQLPLVIGTSYEFEYALAEPHVRRNTAAGGRQAMTGRRFQVQRFNIECHDSGHFWIDVYEKSKLVGHEEFNPLDFDGLPEAFSTMSGTMRAYVGLPSEHARVVVRTDSFQPIWLISAQWEGHLMTYGSQL